MDEIIKYFNAIIFIISGIIKVAMTGNPQGILLLFIVTIIAVVILMYVIGFYYLITLRWKKALIFFLLGYFIWIFFIRGRKTT